MVLVGLNEIQKMIWKNAGARQVPSKTKKTCVKLEEAVNDSTGNVGV